MQVTSIIDILILSFDLWLLSITREIWYPMFKRFSTTESTLVRSLKQTWTKSINPHQEEGILTHSQMICHINCEICCSLSWISGSQSTRVQFMFSRRKRLQENPIPITYSLGLTSRRTKDVMGWISYTKQWWCCTVLACLVRTLLSIPVSSLQSYPVIGEGSESSEGFRGLLA